MSHRSVLGAKRQKWTKDLKTVQCEARHEQKQAPHQTKSIIDAISWNWPRNGWMAVVIIMIKTATKMKASATKQQLKLQEILKEAK